MALKDVWVDLGNIVPGLPDSGDAISADEINEIAHAVIQVENNKAEANLSNVSNEIFKSKADAAGVGGGGGSVDAYTKGESDSRFAQKADTYTKEETEQISVGFVNSYAEYAEGLFAHKAHNLIGYGITDAYTKDEVNSLVGDIETALDGIISLQSSYIGGEGA